MNRSSSCAGGAGVEDIVKEAFVKGYRALGGFRAGSPFRPWILRIVANEARNRRRAAGRRARLELRVEAGRPSGDAAPSPEATVVEEDERRMLLEAVNRLREEDRLVIGCRFFLELSERETAETLGIRPGTVKSRTARSLVRLR